MKPAPVLLALLLTTSLAALGGVGAIGAKAAAPASTAPATSPTETAPGHGPADRRVYFGELHLHTTMSFDAWTFGTKVTPDEAYRFARGETVMISPTQLAQEQGRTSAAPVPARRAWPLDFAAVTDHAEYLGAVAQLENPDSVFARTGIGQRLKTGGRAAFFAAGEAMRGVNNETSADLKAAAQAANGWSVEIKAVNDNYQPGKFTTLLAYEWTSTPGRGVHMHRNVIFNSNTAPAPFTSVDSNNPVDLWTFMDGVRRGGLDVLAIPHNSNLSDGLEFDWNGYDGKPIDRARALQQARNEPLVEIAQTKGTSETTPELSPSDEFANFEIMDRVYAGEAGPRQHGSYVREGYGRGLVLQSKLGANPFKMGMVGASDIHNGLSVSDEKSTGPSSNGLDQKTMGITGQKLRAALGLIGDGEAVRPNGQRENDPLQFASAGITGVWAEENTRAAIFAALKRKETFATSGTRIRVRMFGGWTFGPQAMAARDWVAQAYAHGTPMGGDLSAPAGKTSPRFAIQALKDPTGANLDRIQIVKVWLTADGFKEKVFDAVLSGGRTVDPNTGKAPPVGNTVDLKTGAYDNTIGARMLSAVWRDPAFDAKTPAVYYARVLEVPTPRWSTLTAIANHLPIPAKAPATIQERAWTSPIWYTPPSI
ncbi:DUF3604 domain-containing protein [Phenylobacterium sp.]|uniref:DUF3604 domain-containing protein n=1 Tax=Phenylobacterium sp. TaxID=1871053 RepID=UPI00374CA5BB